VLPQPPPAIQKATPVVLDRRPGCSLSALEPYYTAAPGTPPRPASPVEPLARQRHRPNGNFSARNSPSRRGRTETGGHDAWFGWCTRCPGAITRRGPSVLPSTRRYYGGDPSWKKGEDAGLQKRFNEVDAFSYHPIDKNTLGDTPFSATLPGKR